MRSDMPRTTGKPLRAISSRSVWRHSGFSATGSWRHRALKFCLLLGWVGLSAVSSGAGFWETFFDGEQLTAVNAKEFNGYVRAKLPSGSFQPETFVFGNGGRLTGNIMRDPTLDGVSFPAIARLLAGPLASQNYLPAKDPKSTKLLIMVYWGMTYGGAGGISVSGPTQDRINYRNANLLGFESEARLIGDLSSSMTVRGQIIRTLHAYELSDVEVNRYYVIMRAFDFQSAWHQKKLNLLWETRFSLSERRHGFVQDLPSMAKSAALYFGQDSYGMVRRPLIREGHVTLGEPKVLGIVDEETAIGARESVPVPLSISGDWQSTTPGRLPVIVHIDPNGHSTFENPSQHAILPARVSVNGDSVTVIVPGWDISLRGTHKGDHISGRIAEYGKSGPINLTKTPNPVGGNQSDGDDAERGGDTLRKSSPEQPTGH
jgi:hypothetical protein